MPNPTVSVIINCLNGERYLSEAIDSVFAQTYGDWEIIFWDNASTDATPDIAHRYGDRVRYFRSESTHSLGKARNLALQQARGDYVAFLDADDIWMPRKLERQIPLFEADRRVGLVYCDSLFFDERGQVLGRLFAKRAPHHGHVFGELLANYFLSMETVVIRRRAVAALDEWFDERLTLTEEKDLFLRLAYRNTCAYVDEALSQWRVHQASWTHTHYELFSVENRLILEKLRSKWPEVDQHYTSEVQVLERRIVWQEAVGHWKVGNCRKCRAVLRHFAMRDLKMTAAYGLSFLGPRAFPLLARLYFGWAR